jgi:hypothetical protein
MLGYITGSIGFLYGVISSYTSNKSMEDKNTKNNEKIQSCDNIQTQNNGIYYNGIDCNHPNFMGIIPIDSTKIITESMLNNPDDPDYIGYFFKEHLPFYRNKFNL